MAKINVSDAKKKAISNAIIDSNFFIAGIGHFDLKEKDIARFIEALFSCCPNKSLEELYQELRF